MMVASNKRLAGPAGFVFYADAKVKNNCNPYVPLVESHCEDTDKSSCCPIESHGMFSFAFLGECSI
jgi:hypothetical protein